MEISKVVSCIGHCQVAKERYEEVEGEVDEVV